MRLLVGVITIVLFLIGSGFWINDQLLDSSNRLISQIDKVSRQVSEEDWAGAQMQADELEKRWKQEAHWWPVFLEHQEMDNIEFSLARCQKYVTARDDALAMGQLSEIRLMIEHIPRKEQINLENIL